MFAWLFVEWYTWRIGESSYMYFYLWRYILKVYETHRPDRVYSTGKKEYERGSAIICHKSDVIQIYAWICEATFFESGLKCIAMLLISVEA